MDIGKIIKNRRIEKGLTLEQVGDKVGVGKSTVRKWETGMIENMGRDKIAALSKVLDISPLVLLNIEADEQIYESAGIDFMRLPLYNDRLCCGNGGFVEDNIVEYIPVPSKGLSTFRDNYCLIAKGESMKDAGISDGDLLVFEKVPKVDNGVIGCFCVGENEAMCKKYKEQNGIVMLQPMNSDFEPIIIDPLNTNFRCIGRLKKVIKNFDWGD